MKMLEYDAPLMWVVIALLGLGLVMVYSASIVMPDAPKYASYQANHFLLRHVISLLLGGFAAFCVFWAPLKLWDRFASKFFLFALALLVIVLIPPFGKGVNGAHRWLALGPLNLQPSEIMKLAVTVYAANYTVRKQALMHSFGQGFFAHGVGGELYRSVVIA